MPEGIALRRAFMPRWAHLPLSGKGAARFGGRWNLVGAPTIYAARSFYGLGRIQRGFVQHSALVIMLRLYGASLADLTDSATLDRLAIDSGIHDCKWRAILAADVTPHSVRERLLAEDFDGVIYPSFMSPGGGCVALWGWNAEGAPRLEAVDPEGRPPAMPASYL